MPSPAKIFLTLALAAASLAAPGPQPARNSTVRQYMKPLVTNPEAHARLVNDTGFQPTELSAADRTAIKSIPLEGRADDDGGARTTTHARSLPDGLAAGIRRRQNVIEQECYPGPNIPDRDDCAAVCEHVSEQQGATLVPPLQIWALELGNCIFEMANLSPCEDLYVDPIASLGQYCSSMWFECIVGNNLIFNKLEDGYIEISNPNAAFTLSGLEPLPPYPSLPC